MTERKKAEEAVLENKEAAERAKAEAERASNAKSEFLSRMSHELRFRQAMCRKFQSD
jgi:signal transduction histidine kinase